MKRIFLVHRWEGNPNSDWYQWLKGELEKKGFEVNIPKMPDSSNPKIEKWVSHLKDVVGEVDENTFFVGHSVGCQTIMRYLEGLDSDIKVGGCVFVAGWFNLTDVTLEDEDVKEVANPWLWAPINFQKIKIHTNKFVVIQSDNDPFVPSTDAEIFRDKLNAKVIVEHEKGHISEEEGVEKLDSILQAVLDIVSPKN